MKLLSLSDKKIDLSKYSKNDFQQVVEGLLSRWKDYIFEILRVKDENQEKLRDICYWVLYFMRKYKMQIDDLIYSQNDIEKKVKSSNDFFDRGFLSAFKEEVLNNISNQEILEELIEQRWLIKVVFNLENLEVWDISENISKYWYKSWEFLLWNKTIFDLIVLEDRERVFEEFNEKIYNQWLTKFNIKFRILSNNWEIKHFDTSVLVIKDEQNQPKNVSLLMQDITDFDKLNAIFKSYTKAVSNSVVFQIVNKLWEITFINELYKKLSWDTQEVVNKKTSEMKWIIVDKWKTWGNMWETILKWEVWRWIIKNPKRDGSWEFYYVDTVITPNIDENWEIKEFIAIRSDVTELVKLKDEFLELNQEYKEVLNSTGQLLWVVDENGKISNINKSFIKKLWYKRNDVIWKNMSNFVSEESQEMLSENIKSFWSKRNRTYELVLKTKKWDKISFLLHGTSIFDSDNKFVKAVWFLTDVTELKETQEKLRIASITDSLTWVYNRREFFRVLPEMYEKYKSWEISDLSLAMIDIDFFKNINDAYWHSIWDDVLKYVWEELKKLSNDVLVVGRLWWEEFWIMWINKSKEELKSVVEKLMEKFYKKVFNVDDKSFSFTISSWIASVKDLSENDSLYIKADESLYIAKMQWRNRIV